MANNKKGNKRNLNDNDNDINNNNDNNTCSNLLLP